MARNRPGLLQTILGALLAFVFARVVIGLVRALFGPAGPERRGDTARPAGASARRRSRRVPRIDRSSAIDVPFTVLQDGLPTGPSPTPPRETAAPVRRAG